MNLKCLKQLNDDNLEEKKDKNSTYNLLKKKYFLSMNVKSSKNGKKLYNSIELIPHQFHPQKILIKICIVSMKNVPLIGQ